MDHSYARVSSRNFAIYRDGSLDCNICHHSSYGMTQHREHLADAHHWIPTTAAFTCRHCGIDRFYDEYDRKDHEQTCPSMQLLQRRQAALTSFARCGWCDNHGTNNNELAKHFLVRHMNVLQ
ncbi:hypothetical protein PMAYCL1PPCAC_01578, partial [Pristionchus mayeri]